MDTPEQLRAKGQRISALADAELNESVRRSLIEIALEYDRLAEKLKLRQPTR
jgi:hypothetical protein